jgi:DNA helicase II / ATP-dependent DNA helicase PcrA
MKDVGFSYLDELNDIQRQAATNLDGPVMVIAGPGSGKTRVLTYRIAHIINTGNKPGEILALTFTNKAAREMKDRIERVVGSQAQRVWAGTFHSLFARILRVEAHRIGYPNDFTIYDTDDTKSVITEIINQMNLDKKVYAPGAVRSRISAAKSNLITPKLYVNNEELMALDRMNRRPLIHQIYEKYSAKCLRAGAMDFDDLLLQMYRLLFTNPDNIRSKYQQQFRYIMVDEFQDTNYLQYEIIKLLAVYDGSQRNICIVGDDAQSIYSFRGATIENILHFEHDFKDLKVFKLEQNYRSTQHIVDAANEIINNNKKQIQKKIWTDKIDGHKIKIIKAASETEEGKRVADTIIEQKNRYNLQNKDIAILYRTNGQSRIFEEQLRRYNILYRIYGGLSFYARKEIKDLIAYMRLVVNDKDDEALKRVINYPRRGIGDTTVDQLAAIAEDNEMSMWDALTKISFANNRGKKALDSFVQLIYAFKAKAQSANAYEIADYIARFSGIVDTLKTDGSIEALGKIENITSLLDGIKEFVEDDEIEGNEEIDRDKSLSTFLQTISLMTDSDEDKENQDTVTLMSVHAAKGLEFKSVFVVGLEENLFPSYMALSESNQVDEERRLFYVAITRAEEHLTLTYANSRYQYGDMRYNDPSRFLEEIPQQSLDSITIINKKPTFPEPKILGMRPLGAKKPAINVDPSSFVAAHPNDIKVGMNVVHLKFGQGNVTHIDERKVATIIFDDLNENQEKRIVLQYAKLQIVEE